MTPTIDLLLGSPTAADLADLHALLRDAVEGGASVGFILPLADAEIATYWAGVLADVAAGKRVLLVARDDARIVGSVQLELAQRTNSRHRCELQKLLVLRIYRGRGLGAALMTAAENSARSHQRERQRPRSVCPLRLHARRRHPPLRHRSRRPADRHGYLLQTPPA